MEIARTTKISHPQQCTGWRTDVNDTSAHLLTWAWNACTNVGRIYEPIIKIKSGREWNFHHHQVNHHRPASQPTTLFNPTLPSIHVYELIHRCLCKCKHSRRRWSSMLYVLLHSSLLHPVRLHAVLYVRTYVVWFVRWAKSLIPWCCSRSLFSCMLPLWRPDKSLTLPLAPSISCICMWS